MAAAFLVGINAVSEALQHDPAALDELFVDARVRNPRLAALVQRARELGLAVQPVAAEQLSRLAGHARHQGVAARMKPARNHGEGDLDALLERSERPLLLILDGVQDPHNLGACLRSAEAAGVDAVIVPRDRAVGVTATVRKVASGAADRVPLIRVTNLARTMKVLKAAGIWIVGLDGRAEQSIHASDLTGPLAIAMGGEAEGLRRLTREHCDFLARIPMRGRVESLNVSVATGVALFEAVRQRGA
ncbi:MAG: 23S rRNA (guanosine-2'-O-)-methyltransferase RlmB [Lysobacteraceae bacterium]|nr:MAG: 23S rRNA (guanosine-2'-O-)-methyltransferase RlmB [Xanthomonadaceae bacterium]